MRAAIAASFAIALVALVVSLQGRAPPAPPPGIDELKAEVSSLRASVDRASAELRDLGVQVREVGAVVADLRARSPAGAALPPSADAAAVGSAQRLDELTRALDALAEKLGRMDEATASPQVLPRDSTAVETAEQKAAAVSDSQRIALDRELPAADRIQALRQLRSRGGRSREVALAMIELIQDPSLSSGLRADVIRNLHRVNFEELKAPLLHSVVQDPDPEVRSEAAETLDAFAGDGVVRETLSHVSENDADAEVRAEASRSLASSETRRGTEAAGR
jgi:CheY-like chemotaxis protein